MAKAIVTGGAVRVGAEICRSLADQGYDIILVFNSSIEKAKDLAIEIQKKDVKCHLYKYDLSKKENVDKFFAEVQKSHDDVELLVNNAAIFGRHSFLETSEQIFDDHMNLNFKAPFFLTQNYARYISKNSYVEKAHIVNIQDTQITKNNCTHFAYLLAKKSLNSLTQMSAKELAPNIRVNSISIGTVIDDIGIDKEKAKELEEKTPLKQNPTTDELVEAILFLNKSKHITGENIFIDSGMHLL